MRTSVMRRQRRRRPWRRGRWCTCTPSKPAKRGKSARKKGAAAIASEQEARTWLTGEAEERGFKNFEPEVRAGGVT